MTAARGALLLTAAFMVAVAIASTSVAGAVTDASSYVVQLDGRTRGDAQSSLFMSSHLMTQNEVEDLKVRFGVSIPGEAYEPAVVDGFGTGLTPRSSAEWEQLVGEVVVFEVETLPDAVPASFDLSDDPEFPAVGNQASQGSCGAWAGTYYSYGYLEAIDNAWTEAGVGETTQLLSPAWTYNMVNNGTDRGSWIDTNMMVVRDWGVPTMALMPYDQYDYKSWGSPESFREAPLHRASEVGYLVYSPVTTVDAIKALVAAGTPVAFAMDANEFTSGFSDGNYIISSSEYSSTTLNHAQTIVGYDDSLTDDSDTGAFRVVNSWGSSWGDSGYYWFTYSALEELGHLGVLHLNFIVDIADYQPSLLGVWHFDTAPSRASSISLSVGSTPAPGNTKVPFFEGGDFNTRLRFPPFMCLDMTEHATTFWSEGGMHLSIGDARYDGVLSSFRVEGYEPPSPPGRASQVSGQSPDVPAETPTSVSADLDYYDAISPQEALDCGALEWSSSGQATWTGVDHHSSGDGDSMQTGDVSDGAYSRLEVDVEGPVEVSFDWKVSSQSGQDMLKFFVDEAVAESISGDTDWERVSLMLDTGSHTLAWSYTKDDSSSMLDDSGWLDSVVLTGYVVEPPVITLAGSYTTEADALFTVEPATLEYPPYSEVTVWYDWGDSGPWSTSSLVEGYSATHVYASPGTYSLTAYAADDSGNNVSDDAQVRVLDPNLVPVIVASTMSPTVDHVLPGETVTFHIQVSDLEGGSLTLVSSYGDGSSEDTSSQDAVTPEEVVEFELSHVYVEGSDVSYAATFTAMDSDEHVLPWDVFTIYVVVNSPPTAIVSADHDSVDTGYTVVFDASASSDAETDHAALQYRWDWTGDGVWDTAWCLASEVSHSYDAPGEYDASMEVMDGIGLVSSSSVSVSVTGEAIPEFSILVVPVFAAVLALLLARSARRRGD